MKLWYRYIIEYYLFIKIKIFLFVTPWMIPESVILSELNQTQKANTA